MRTLHFKGKQLKEIDSCIWRMDPIGPMRVGVHLIGTESILTRIQEDKSIEQAANVATLPGVVDPVLTMPDIHQGYGFPIGGVAAFRLHDGVVSPGGVGYDINCGVRTLTTSLCRDEVHRPKILRALVGDLFCNIPCGVGSRRKDLVLRNQDLDEILRRGIDWAVKKGFACEADQTHIEENGCLKNANPEKVGERAKERGANQLGTLGSGNHFLEIQYVDEIWDEEKAVDFGLSKDQVVVTIHTGSRGLGYQVCSDYLHVGIKAAQKYGIQLLDRELAAAPLDSPEGRDYLNAMASAANFAFVNRQVITYWTREIFKRRFKGCQLKLLYDVCHNIAKFEAMPINGKSQKVCIHRKGATRAYPGQPVIIPGDMGRYSFILVGKSESMKQSFGSACHGAGRELSRTRAKKLARGRAIQRELEDRGIYVQAAGRTTLLEEMPDAYKDVSEVVEATAQASLAGVVARLKPIGVIKG